MYTCYYVVRAPVARQQILTCVSGLAVFSALSALIAAHARMDTATEERCFLYDPCLYILSETISVCSGVQWSEVSWLVSSQKTAAVRSL
jgi:hypothetical protein